MTPEGGELPEGSFACPWCGAAVREADAPTTCAGCRDSLVVGKEFRIARHLGRTVYRGVRTKDGHAVTIKIHTPPDDDDWTAWELFERSCNVLQQLHHPGLPTVFAFERTDKGRLVLVREDFDGGTLEERVRDGDERLAPAQVEELLRGLLELLAYLQDRVPPVVHRDIKPSNIMFRGASSGEPVLVDFDTIVSRRSGLTIVGTPGYAAPEQFAADAVPASDVYGVGTTMLFVVTHTDADALPRSEGRFRIDDRLETLDDHLRAILLRMVEPDLSKRYATARAVLADLGAPHPTPASHPRAGGHARGKKAHKEKRARAKASKPKAAPAPVAAPAAEAAPKAAAVAGKRRSSIAGWVAAVILVALVGAGALSSRRSKPRSPPLKVDLYGNDDLDKKCRAGDGESCFDLGLRTASGLKGLSKDLVKAAQYYDLGCKSGDADSCNNLGVAYAKGEGVGKDPVRAAATYEKGCAAKSALACKNLGWMYESGEGVAKDVNKAFANRSRSCDLGNGEACSAVGVMYEQGQGVAADDRKAASYFGLSCDHGYAWGCRNYGLELRDGQGVDKDERRAVALFKRACDDKESDGCYQLGRMAAEGRGTDKDLSRAASLYDKACDDGVMAACDALGKMYASGNGVAKDRARAVVLFVSACDAGVPGACADFETYAGAP